MLENLKRRLYNDCETTSALEAAAERLADDDEDIKDAFLDAEADPENAVIGAENDPEIAKLVDELPADDDNVSTKDVEKAIEAFVPLNDEEDDEDYEDDDDDLDDDDSEPVDEGDLIDLDDNGFMDSLDSTVESFIDDDFSDLGIIFEADDTIDADTDDEDDDDDLDDDDSEPVDEGDLIEPDFIEDFID